jgi:hypothetical protein
MTQNRNILARYWVSNVHHSVWVEGMVESCWFWPVRITLSSYWLLTKPVATKCLPKGANSDEDLGVWVEGYGGVELVLTYKNKALFSYWYLREPIATRISVWKSCVGYGGVVLALTNENKALFPDWYLREPIATRISVCESRGMVESCWSCASRGLMKSTVDTSACLINKTTLFANVFS